jgi:hypothetical protein
LSCRVDAKAMICVRQSYYYSVPARLAGRRGARSRWALTGWTSCMTGVLVGPAHPITAQGLLLHRTLPTEAVARRDRRSGGWWVVLPQVRDRGHPSGCGGPWRKFRYTLANFVSPDMPPRAACQPEPICGRTPPGVKRLSQTGHGRPGVVPRRDLGCGVPGLSWVCGSGPPLLGCRGWINLPGPRSPLPGPPAGYPRFPGPDQTVIVGPYQVDRTRSR